jgi:hypothetical protein
LIRILLDMLRLRSAPQDLPAATGLAFLLAVAYAVQGIVTDRALDGADAAPRSLLAIAVQLGAISACSVARQAQFRRPSALAGTGVTSAAHALLSRAWTAATWPGLATRIVQWSLAVDISSGTLSIKMSFGILVAVLIFGANFIILKAVFG